MRSDRRRPASTSSVPPLPRPAGRATNPLAHQRVVRIFRHARERHGEQLIRSAVAVRREDERLAVGRELAARLVPRALRDVVFLLRLDVVEIDFGVLLVVAPAVDEPVAVGRVLRDGEAAGRIVRELARLAAGDVDFEDLVVGRIRELLRVRRPGDVVLLAPATVVSFFRVAAGDVVQPDLLLAALVGDVRDLAAVGRILLAAIAPRGIRDLRFLADALLRRHDHDLAVIVDRHVLAARRDAESFGAALRGQHVDVEVLRVERQRDG